ncbi:phage portal protein [Pseudalkalibacillus sp. JSM 102089]|uniref:phage portal protein n=1 Tax=Pseudalkalibacillus sp. JSM 102089 TaxID=3229856 RepID=UPI0035265E0E
MLFRKSEKRSYTFQDVELAKLLGIPIDGISASKVKEATYFTCLRILSDTISKLGLKLYRETGNGISKASDHYLYSMLKLRPNKNMSSSDFWKGVEYQRNHYGHSVVVIQSANNGKIEALHPLNMSNVEIWVDDKAVIGRTPSIWYVYRSTDKEYKFSSDEVLHFKGLTTDGINSLSVRECLNKTIENLQYGSEYVNKYFKGGLSAKGLLQYTGDIEPGAANRMKDRFEKMASGMDNVGGILPVPMGFTFSSINSNMADAQFLEINKFSIQQIAAAFGIKQHMVNDLSGAKFNNVQQQNEEFYRDTLQSILTMYEQELTWKLLTDREKLNHFFQFNVDSILRTDIKTRYDAYGVGIDKGFLTPNEARLKEDMPTMDGADSLIVNGSMQPLDKVGMAYEEPVEPPIEGGDIDE